jgi:hypothetical protein
MDHLPSWIQALSAIANLVLVLILARITARYAADTNRMVDEIRRQNRPYVFIALFPHRVGKEHDEDRLIVRNTGNRVAIDIRLEVLQDANIWFTFWEEVDDQGHAAPLDEVVAVSTLNSVKYGIQSLVPDESTPLGYIPRGVPIRHERQELQYRIRYTDGAGTPYEESLRLVYWC